MLTWLNGRVEGVSELPAEIREAAELSVQVVGNPATVNLGFRGYEQTWRSERDPLLVRSFLAAIRSRRARRKGWLCGQDWDKRYECGRPGVGLSDCGLWPGDSSLDHTPNEHLPVAEYWQAVLVMEQTLRNLGAMLQAAD